MTNDGIGADDGARSGIGGLDSGPPVRMQDVGAEAGQTDARLAARGAAPPRRSPARATRVDGAPGGLVDTDMTLPANGSGSADGPAGFSSEKQRRAWLYKQKKKQRARAGPGPTD